MHSDPMVVDAVTRHIVDFYLEANEKLFKLAGNKIDAFFFGNDFGSQLDLLILPEHFDRFIMPYFRELTDLAHCYGYKVVYLDPILSYPQAMNQFCLMCRQKILSQWRRLNNHKHSRCASPAPFPIFAKMRIIFPENSCGIHKKHLRQKLS